MTADATFARAVRGPVLLITLGSLFALDQSGRYYFNQTWPVLIIVFGLMKLLEHSMAKANAAYAPYPPAPPTNTPAGPTQTGEIR